ncbi:hypothetical protein [Kribbella solani]|uniref:Uncharacterized protein n=1 Tax=Kribbella solani TaxID=236067 RepID=A0A841DMQ6_9ACTN|nr:hypothetical protein [Kribbella solani]MBB5980414.1 hypothetical protein [Kribbella solani]
MATEGRDLPAEYSGLYFTRDSRFDLVLAAEYDVFGFALYNSGLIVLIVDSTNLPNWYPIDMFEIEDGRIPAGWSFSPRAGGTAGMAALWGYSRLAGDEAFSEALTVHEDAALTVFWDEIVPLTVKPADGHS